MAPADGNPFEDEMAGQLLEAAFDLLAKGGWGHFSLRAVAESIGAAGSAASHRFGDRAGLVAAVCHAAVERERSETDRFLPGLRVETDQDLAAVLSEWLEQRVRWNRKQARACSELLLVSYRDPACHAFAGYWLEVCRQMIARLYPALDDEACGAVAAFLSVEIAYWLLLADDPLFRLSSREALERAIRMARGAEGPQPAFFLGQTLEQPDARRVPDLSGTKLRIIEATVRIILESGVQAITHREIAKQSGASLSSLTYHFETLTDLIRQGFQQLFSPPAGKPPPPLPQRAVVPYELVLQALRDPFLAPLAATVRRRYAGGLFTARIEPYELQAMAVREVGTMIRTAQTLARL